MFRLWNEVQASMDASIVLDFSKCNFIRHNGVAFLGGLIRFAEAHGKTATVDWSTVRLPILRNLQQNGFAGAFGSHQGPWAGNSIPFREDRCENEAAIMEYLKTNWLGHRAVKVSQRLGNAIRGVVWEIFCNAFEHSESPVGVFTCGQLYPKREQLCLSVVDFGTGIPNKVSAFRRRPWDAPSESLKWAFVPGNTTQRTDKKSRGLGLDLLRNFVSANGGQLSVYSDGAYVQVTKAGAIYKNLSERFRGTIVDIRLKCDESMYILASELSEKPFF